MWQAETFDPKTIDRELGWAAGLGFNTMRVFLHDLLWKQDAEGFLKRIERFLAIAEKHKIERCSCSSIAAGIRCRSWASSAAEARRAQLRLGADPGAEALQNPAQDPRLESMSKAWSRLSRTTSASSAGTCGTSRRIRTRPLRQARTEEQGRSRPGAAAESLRVGAMSATRQPLTCGVAGRLDATKRYGDAARADRPFRHHLVSQLQRAEESEALKSLQRYGRPILCTEYMARRQEHLRGAAPVVKKDKVAAYRWGFVAGKTQTICPGIRGRNPTWIVNHPSGSTRSSNRTARPTAPKRSN